jgi:maltoporin
VREEFMNFILTLILIANFNLQQTSDGTTLGTKDSTKVESSNDPIPPVVVPEKKIQPEKVEKVTPVKEPEKKTLPVLSKALTIKKKYPFGQFGFGSYGRVNFGSNRDGEPIYQNNIVSHGPRLEESTYLELDFYYIFQPFKDLKTKMVTTLALNDSLFHYNAEWKTGMAIRNLYMEFSQKSMKNLSFWVGSRMYRGDDIYLLDYWPLDNLNTLGAGIWYDDKGKESGLRGGFHLGTNRVLGKYQYQEAIVSTPFVGSETIPTLNRQRTIASLKMTWWKKINKKIGFKIKGYSEYHMLPSGTYNALGEPDEQIELPAEQGFVVGAQLGVWGFAPDSFVNLFVRYGTGIGAYGEFSQPWSAGSQDLDTNYSAEGASDLVIAMTGNYLIKKRFGLMFGGYLRYFKDADSSDYDWDDGYEMVFALRPHLWLPELNKNLVIAAEFSYQFTERSGLNPETQETAHPSVMKFSIMPTWISGFNTYSRPAIRLVYTVSKSNDDAGLWFHSADYRRDRTIEHFIGIQAEWWFNSSTYK